MKNKAFIIALIFVFIICINAKAQSLTVGKTVQTINIFNTNNEKTAIPLIGKMVVSIFYTDPDVKDVNDPLSNAILAKKFPIDKYKGIGVGNIADTWMPNAAIRVAARSKEKQFPNSIILLDPGHLLSISWGLGDCNDAGVVIIIGKDQKVKYIKSIKTQDESKAAIPTVIKIIEDEMKN